MYCGLRAGEKGEPMGGSCAVSPMKMSLLFILCVV